MFPNERGITMPITYSIDREDNLIVENWTGEVCGDELADHWRGYVDNPEVMEIRKTIADLRESHISITGSELDFLIRSIVLPKIGELGWKTAIVVSDPLQYGLSRQYQVFAERYSEDAIFNDMDEARRWLIEQ